MPSYHVSSSGKVVKCASDPCRLHGGSDFQAKDAEQAEQIGQILVAELYQDQVNDYNQKQSEKASNNSIKDEYQLNQDALNNLCYAANLGESEYFNHHYQEVGRFERTQTINGNRHVDFTDNEAVRQELFNQHTQAKVRSHEKDTNLIEGSSLSYSQLKEGTIKYAREHNITMPTDEKGNPNPTDNQMAGYAMVHSFDARRDYMNEQKLNREAGIDPVKAKENQRKVRLRAGKLLDATPEQLNQMWSKTTGVEGAKMPDTVKSNLMENAWKQASDRKRLSIMRSNPEVAKYAPSSEIASFMRHTRPSNKQLEGLSKTQRAEAIRNYRFSKLEQLYKTNTIVFNKAIIAGAISEKDGKAWENKHRLTNKDENGTSHKGENFVYSDSMRCANAILVARGVAQGHAPYKLREKSPTEKRFSEEERRRQNYNRNQHRKYLAGVMKSMDAHNFTDANGAYNARAHAAAMDKLPKFALTTVLADGNVPPKAVAQYLRLQDEKVEKYALSHSRYHTVYSLNHTVTIRNDKGEEVTIPKHLQKNHINEYIIYAKYPQAHNDCVVLRERLEQDRKKVEKELAEGKAKTATVEA